MFSLYWNSLFMYTVHKSRFYAVLFRQFVVCRLIILCLKWNTFKNNKCRHFFWQNHSSSFVVMWVVITKNLVLIGSAVLAVTVYRQTNIQPSQVYISIVLNTTDHGTERLSGLLYLWDLYPTLLLIFLRNNILLNWIKLLRNINKSTYANMYKYNW